MIVAGLIRAAQTKVILRSVVIWNPNTSRALYVGSPYEVPETIKYKVVNSYRYDDKKNRMIIRI